MDPPSTAYISSVDAASCYFRNLALVTWAIFTPLHSLILYNGISIVIPTDNQAEYYVVIGLLVDALYFYTLHLHVRLDSLLLVMQLNGVYRVHNPIPFRRYLRVKILMREFEIITFSHVPKAQNEYVDSIGNDILCWHLSHAFHTRQ